MKRKKDVEIVTQEQVKELLDYNPETGLFKWNINNGNKVKAGDTAGSCHYRGYRQIRIDRRWYLSHRLAWLYVYGEFPFGQIDHIDGIRDNNRINNLRVVTQAENNKNKKTYKTNSSGVPGVSWDKKIRKWKVRISRQGRLIYLGVFENFDLAVACRKSAANNLNFHENHGR